MTAQLSAMCIVDYVSIYCVRGDGIKLEDGTITTGTDDFTSASATFTSADVGKVITILGAAGTNVDLTTTIATYVDANSITLTDNASATVSSVPFTYGTDDTTAIRNAIAAISAQTTIGKSGTIFFPEGTYIVNGAFDQTDNSQIALPSVVPENPRTTIKFKGGTTTGANGDSGVGSMIYGTRYGTNGSYSLISGRYAGQTGDMTGVNFMIEDMRFRTVQDPTHSLLDLLDVTEASGKNVTIDTAVTYDATLAVPTHSDSYAIKFPGVLTGNVSHGGWQGLKVKTFYNSLMLGEHTLINDAFLVHAVYAMVFADCRYPAVINYVAVEISKNVMKFTGTTSYLMIRQLDMEHRGTGIWESVLDIEDTTNLGIGEFNYTIFVVDSGSASIQRDGGINIATNNIKTGQKEIVSSVGEALRVVASSTDSSTSGGSVFLLQNDGTAVGNGSRVGFIGFGGLSDVANTYVYGGAIQAQSAEAFTSTSAGTNLRFRTAGLGSVSATERMAIMYNGNVGVGTTTPNSLLQVGATNSSAFRVTSGGNVGIGTTDPGATLDIGTGNLRVGIGTTTAGTLVCVKSISSGTSILGYCTGSLTDSICGTCN